MSDILIVNKLGKYFNYQQPLLARLGRRRSADRRQVRAVEEVSFAVRKGAIFAILGESGSGKTTLVRCILRLAEPSCGEVLFHGENILAMGPDEFNLQVRTRMRMIFQHPDAVLNPAFTVRKVLQQALELQPGSDSVDGAAEMAGRLAEVGLSAEYLPKYPHELSGGEKRRIGICRALLTNPEIIFADELISGLDVFLQQQILGLFLEIKKEKQLTTIYISHDVGLVHQVADDVAIMFAGRFVEMGPRVMLTGAGPLPASRSTLNHPYTAELIGCHLAIHPSTRQQQRQSGVVNNQNNGHSNGQANGHAGCAYRLRCELHKRHDFPKVCEEQAPGLIEVEPKHFIACHLRQPGAVGVPS